MSEIFERMPKLILTAYGGVDMFAGVGLHRCPVCEAVPTGFVYHRKPGSCDCSNFGIGVVLSFYLG